MSNVRTRLRPDELRRGQQVAVDSQTGRAVAGPLMLALGPASRLRGLLGRAPLRPGQGMLLRPCRQIHTFFMTYAIDVVFLDSAGTVLALEAELAPWRVSRYLAGACCVLELPAGQAARAGVEVGQLLIFTRAEADGLQLTDEEAGDNVSRKREPDGP